MNENDNIVRIYTGTELTVNLLKDGIGKSRNFRGYPK